LVESISTYEQLDILLLLVRGGIGRSWSAKAVADSLGAASDDCRVALEALAAIGVLKVGTDLTTFQYSPATAELARNVETLERTYREERATVAMMMSTNAMERVRTSAIRTFAEAFRLRGSKK
jgi:hypothetical protein